MELSPPLHLGVIAIEKGAFGSPLTKVTNFTYIIGIYYIIYIIWIVGQDKALVNCYAYNFQLQKGHNLGLDWSRDTRLYVAFALLRQVSLTYASICWSLEKNW